MRKSVRFRAVAVRAALRVAPDACILDLCCCQGQQLADVFSAFGSREESLRATFKGFMLGLEDHACVLPGREVIAIAEEH